MHGITHDLGPADQNPSAPRLTVLERQVLAAAAQPGTYRAIVEASTGHIIQWVDQPPAAIDWTVPGADIYHPDDAGEVRNLNLLVDDAVTASIRVRAIGRAPWRVVEVTSQPIRLDDSTVAALWTIRLKPN